MATTFKSHIEADLSEPGVSQSPVHHDHYFNAYPCIKTNGSLVRSLSTEGSEISGLNGRSALNEDIDFEDCSPPLKDVEALLKGYSQSPFKLEEEGGQNDDDEDDDFADNGSSPILLSECPEFQAYLQPIEVSTGDNDINEDEIVFGFKSRRNGNSLKNTKEDEDALWELIEAETEALCLSEDGLARCQSNNTPISLGKFPTKEKTSLTSAGGVAALMDCAATEMSQLRVKATVLKRYSPREDRGSPEPSPSPPNPQTPPKISPDECKEKLSATTETLTSLLQIQLAQIDRMSETVRIEFSNQIAHERALLELLELEHERVDSEVKIFEQERGCAPSDLINQFHHLKERLEQQKALIDDLEYQYLEDKTKYEEEKETLMAQLRIQEEKNTDMSPKKEQDENEDAYTYPSSTIILNGSNPRTSSPIYSTPPANPYSAFRHDQNRPGINDNPPEFFKTSNGATSNDKTEVSVSRDVEIQCKPSSSPRVVNCSNGDFSQFSPVSISSSPIRNLRNTSTLLENKASVLSTQTSIFHQQSGHSMNETYYTRREDHNSSPQTNSSLQGGGSNLHTTTTSSSSSLLPSGRDLQQSSCTSSSNNVFRAVPPLLPSMSLNADNPHWNREDSASIRATEEVRIRQRQRTSSASTRQCWQQNEHRPLTRYLPVPDDISFDLRHHLEVTCGHILCSPLLKPHLHVDETTCAGYLYKVDSRVTSTLIDEGGDTATKNSASDKSSCSSVTSALTTSAFFSPSTKRGKKKPIRVTSPSISNGSGGFMATLFNRSRRGKRRWFVLDRRRRLLIYYSCHTSKSSNAASMLKPKDVISFTDIIDVYPDRQGRKVNGNQNSSFCLLLVASCPPISLLNSTQCKPIPTRTRTLFLTAPSPEAMRVWIDALFTCAGAYLCLPYASLSKQKQNEFTKNASDC